MENTTMIVYFGQDLLPYKDKELQVHYPIIGSSFQGSSNTTNVKFYITNIFRQESDIWLAVAKLPNGQIGYTRLETSEDTDGTFINLQLTSWHTQYKGDIYVNLQCYDGGVEFEEDENGFFVPVGVPVVQVTGSVKIAINYATGIVDGGEVDVQTLQELIAYISNKLDRNSGKYLKVIGNTSDINTTAYKDYLSNGDIVYSKTQSNIYVISGTTGSLVATPLSQLNLQDLSLSGDLSVGSFSDILGGDTDLQSILDTKANKVGELPRFEISSSQNIIDFLNSNSLNGKPFVFKSLGDNYIAIFGLVNAELQKYTWLIFNLEYSNRWRGSGVTLTDLKFSDIMTYTYRSDFEYSINKVTSLSSSSTDSQYPSAKCVYDNLELKADKSNTYTKSEIDTKLTSMLVYKGTLTVAELNALSPSLTTTQTGWFYNVSDSGVLNAGNVEVLAGDNVAWTGTSWDKVTMDLSAYDDKFIAAGFFEVQDYNETSGEITFVYASDLYSMSYSSDTGILTIQAN